MTYKILDIDNLYEYAERRTKSYFRKNHSYYLKKDGSFKNNNLKSIHTRNRFMSKKISYIFTTLKNAYKELNKEKWKKRQTYWKSSWKFLGQKKELFIKIRITHLCQNRSFKQNKIENNIDAHCDRIHLYQNAVSEKCSSSCNSCDSYFYN